jgi:hypothetical protein
MIIIMIFVKTTSLTVLVTVFSQTTIVSVFIVFICLWLGLFLRAPHLLVLTKSMIRFLVRIKISHGQDMPRLEVFYVLAADIVQQWH